MTDLEMTKLCAEAMGWSERAKRYGMKIDPLHDDAQAMALVKKFPMESSRQLYMAGATLGHGNTANKVIVECVAKMQKAKDG